MSLAARCARITHKALTSVCSHNLPLREHTASPLSVRQNQNEILSGRRAPREQWTVDGGPSLMRFRIRRVLPSIRPATRSPEVCWQLPLRREDETSPDGRVTSVVRQWDRRHWGEGGEEFHWWCTEDPAAFAGAEPVYRTMRTEIETMAGRKVYKRLAAYLDGRTRPGATVTLLPHPAVRH